MNTILLSTNIKNNFEGFNKIIFEFNRFATVRNSHICIDFNFVKFIDANFAAIIGVYIELFEENNNVVSIGNVGAKVQNVFRKNEFLTNFGFKSLFDDFDTTIPYRKFRPTDDAGFQNYILTKMMNKSDFPKITEMLGKKLVQNIYEMYVNAKSHGICNFIHTCGQVFRGRPDKPLHFCIVDKGINIKQNVVNYFGKEIDSCDAILWAMKRGNTTKVGNLSGGLGLYVIFKFIELNNGKIQVISDNGFYQFSNHGTITKKLDSSFDGTIINLEIKLSDHKSYKLTNE